MDFDKLLDTTSPIEKDRMLKQVLKRQEYNRRYQAKLRQRAKEITLERKIDDNIEFVLAYVKRKYSYEYDNFAAPIIDSEANAVVPGAFTNWVTLSANEYKSIDEAFDVSGLNNELTIEQFSELFLQNYKENNSGGFTKY